MYVISTLISNSNSKSITHLIVLFNISKKIVNYYNQLPDVSWKKVYNVFRIVIVYLSIF